MQLLHLKQKPLAVALHLLLTCSAFTLLQSPSAHADSGSQAESTHVYDVPAGSLTSALNSFARTANVILSFDPALASGKQSAGLKGRHTLKQGFDALLRDTGLQAVLADDGGYTLKKLVVGSESSVVDVLPEVFVRAKKEQTAVTENSGSYTSNTVTIGKGEQKLRDIPQSISIVTRQRIEDQNLTTVAEAMQQTTGITVVSYGSNTAGISMRGYGLDTIQIDGIPVQDSQGAWGTSSQDLTTYDRIEVLRGAAALLQGTGEPGGTVNLVRKRALADFAVKTRLQTGSWDNYRGEVDVTGALDSEGKVRGRVVAMYQDKNSFIDGDYMRKPLLYGTLEVDVSSKTTLSVGATITSMDSRPTFGLPTYADGRVADIKRSTFIGSGWDNKHENNNQYFVELEHHLDQGGEFKLRASAIERRFGLESSAFGDSYIDAAGNFDRILLGSKGKTSDYGVDAYLSQPFNAFDKQHHLLVGFNTRVFNSSTAYAQVFGATQNIFSPVHSIAKPDFVYDPADEYQTRQNGLYGQTRLQLLENTRLILGGRLSNWKTSVKGNPDGSDEFTNQFTPYVGLVQNLNDTYAVYASYSDIFQPQQYSLSANNKMLKPRTGRQYEVGVKGELEGGKLNMHAALFRINDENRAMTDPANPLYSIAVGEVRSQGAEAEISGRLNDQWELIAGYAYTETKYLKAEDSLKGLVFATSTPKHSFKLWNKYRLSDAWAIGGGLDMSSGVYAYDGTNKWEQGAYTLASAQVSYRINPKWNLSLTGSNLFDKKYYSRLEGWSRQTYFGEPRNFMMTLSGSF
ncbi:MULTISPECIES: TonB-dependent receptor [unclassified Methylophilus]|uniref:TonB-dependent siderophore receptor n=1 Tax=unclassified Methylophilus TaxID=2630143 RepID=UPI000361CFF0|nr:MULTISPECIES: TonB-dependent receptor [unclassified Methylophilus]